MLTYLLVLVTIDNLVLDRGVGVYTTEAGSHRQSLSLTLAAVSCALLLVGALLAIPLRAIFGTAFLALVLLPLTALLAAAAVPGLRRLPSPWNERVPALVPLAICNALLLGVVLDEQAAPWELLARALGTALGFALLLLVCTHLRERLRRVPAPFNGTPAFLVTLSFIAMSMQAFG